MRCLWLAFGVAVTAAVVPLAAIPLYAQRGEAVTAIGGAATLVTLPAPAGLAVQTDITALALSWQPVAGAIGYQIEAGPAPAGPWTALVAAPITSNSFSHRPAAGTDPALAQISMHDVPNVPLGKHSFTVRPFGLNGELGPGTTVAVSVQ